MSLSVRFTPARFGQAAGAAKAKAHGIKFDETDLKTAFVPMGTTGIQMDRRGTPLNVAVNPKTHAITIEGHSFDRGSSMWVQLDNVLKAKDPHQRGLISLANRLSTKA